MVTEFAAPDLTANAAAMKSLLIALAAVQIGGTGVELLTCPRSPLVSRSLAAVLLRAAVFGSVFVFLPRHFLTPWKSPR
jgi:hypothetical protein